MHQTITRFVAVLLASTGLLQPLLAADPGFRFELTPMLGFRMGGAFEDSQTNQNSDIDNGGSFGLLANMTDSANTQWELGWSHQSADVEIGGSGAAPAKLKLDIDYFQAGGTYLWDGDLVRPFMVATLGAAHFSPDGEGSSETYFAFSIGGGWKLMPTRRLGLRLEGRFYGTLLDSDSNIFCTSAPSNSGCLIRTRGQLLWQWEMNAGAVFRF